MTLENRPYRYVQSVTTITEQGIVHQLIGTTDSEDRTRGLDDLILRHRAQIGDVGVKTMTVVFMDADGAMSRLEGDRP